jgi:ABC-type polysaccharide/polyol phosphate export permease
MTSDLLLHPFRPIGRRHLALMRQVASIQHKLLDQSTFLGFLWSFLNPLVMLVVLYAFFSQRVGSGVPHYGIYLLVGLVQFTYFSKATASGMRVLQRMRNLVINVIFPKDVLVYSALLADLPEFVISLAATVLIATATGVEPSWALLALPVVVLLQVLTVTWMALLLSVLYTFVRDLDHIFEVAMRLLFFITPIIYHLDMLSPRLRTVALLNPIAHLIGFARTIVLEGRLPNALHFGTFALITVVLGWLAVVLFRRVEPALVERL